MLIKVISLAFDSLYGGFNDQEIRDFLKDKEVIAITDFHFIKNDIPYLTFVLRYFPHRSEVESKVTQKGGRGQDEYWKKLITFENMLLAATNSTAKRII